MVSQLLSPSQPKNFSDVFVLAVLGIHILGLWWMPASSRVPCYAVIFLFWRLCYNGGIGYLLYIQSKHRRLVNWAKRFKIFNDPSTGQNPRPWLYGIIKREMETKIPKNYNFKEAPIEYNTWLVFRRVVDLILMCDFVSYCLFAIACGGTPDNEGPFLTIARWSAGWALFGFNLWVKLDAHRVVKDYAWYWGDFFYLIDQELTFDGVFEMAPHPMYSVGYAGYYGISLMAASYKVLIISLIAHAAQFAFLICVENPHIDKTYNAPPPRKQIENQESHDKGMDGSDDSEENNHPFLSYSPLLPVHNLLGLHNLDFYRILDVAVILLQLQMFALAIFTPSTPLFQALFATNAALWRLWYSLGIGYMLDRQSIKKKWTRHFVKYGEDVEEAWRQWKGIYHLSMTMCYASFIAATWKMYSFPNAWAGLVLFKHVLGFALVSLQVWTAVSIYESLGEFGWFFGDFFFDQAPKLTYSGIYRFLNSPERVIGLAGVWGAALITGSSAIFSLALLSHILSLCFIQFVERPHMQRLYGQSLRRDSGLTRSLKRSLPRPLRRWQGSVDKMLNETVDFVEDFVDAARPRLAAGVSSFVRDSTALFKHPTRISITRLEPDLAGYDPKDYSIEILPLKFPPFKDPEPPTPDRRTDNFLTLSFPFGLPIRIRWTAPINHGAKDWIGLYMVADNASREVTRISSQGRWVATVSDQYDSATSDKGLLRSNVRVSGLKSSNGESGDFLSGEMEFSGDKLWWTTGVFEFRYHHNGKHNVMAISLPFKTFIPRFDDDEEEAAEEASTTTSHSAMPTAPQVSPAIEAALLEIVQHCLDRDPNIAPNNAVQAFGTLVYRDPKYARRVVYAVKHMFGIEFAPAVVQADGCVRNLAWRVGNAKRVLAPYNLGVGDSRAGRRTPGEGKDRGSS